MIKCCQTVLVMLVTMVTADVPAEASDCIVHIIMAMAAAWCQYALSTFIRSFIYCYACYT